MDSAAARQGDARQAEVPSQCTFTAMQHLIHIHYQTQVKGGKPIAMSVIRSRRSELRSVPACRMTPELRFLISGFWKDVPVRQRVTETDCFARAVCINLALLFLEYKNWAVDPERLMSWIHFLRSVIEDVDIETKSLPRRDTTFGQLEYFETVLHRIVGRVGHALALQTLRCVCSTRAAAANPRSIFPALALVELCKFCVPELASALEERPHQQQVIESFELFPYVYLNGSTKHCARCKQSWSSSEREPKFHVVVLDVAEPGPSVATTPLVLCVWDSQFPSSFSVTVDATDVLFRPDRCFVRTLARLWIEHGQLLLSRLSGT